MNAFDIKEQLQAEMSRANIDYIARQIGNDREKFADLFNLVFENKKLSLRAAWAISAISDKHPELLHPYIEKVIDSLEVFEHSGVHRLFLRYLAEVEIDEDLQGVLYDICYRWLLSKDEPIAVKVHCMQILYNIAKTEPALNNELRLIIEELVDHESAGIRSRSRHLLDKL